MVTIRISGRQSRMAQGRVTFYVACNPWSAPLQLCLWRHVMAPAVPAPIKMMGWRLTVLSARLLTHAPKLWKGPRQRPSLIADQISALRHSIAFRKVQALALQTPGCMMSSRAKAGLRASFCTAQVRWTPMPWPQAALRPQPNPVKVFSKLSPAVRMLGKPHPAVCSPSAPTFPSQRLLRHPQVSAALLREGRRPKRVATAVEHLRRGTNLNPLHASAAQQRRLQRSRPCAAAEGRQWDPS